MKRLSLLAAASLLAISAHATQPGNNGGGNGGCGVGQQTNGCGAQGGAGGAGGSGTGVGVGVGIAGAASNASANASGGNAGAAVVGSGNSSNSNRNTNAQGQQQGQAQSSRNSNRNASTSASTSGGNTMTGGAVSVNVEGAAGDVTNYAAQERAPVATAYAAPLVSSNGTCMGSSSGGGQGGGFGLSIGTTWTDNNCDIRYDAEALRAAGLADAAKFRLCQKPELKAAIEASGGTCDAKAKTAAVVPAASVTRASGTADVKPQYQDPIIRSRLGLPPL